MYNSPINQCVLTKYKKEKLKDWIKMKIYFKKKSMSHLTNLENVENVS